MLALILGELSLSVAFTLIAGCYGALLGELFPPRVRYTEIGLFYNLAFAIFGGSAPLIITLLIKYFHNRLHLLSI